MPRGSGPPSSRSGEGKGVGGWRIRATPGAGRGGRSSCLLLLTLFGCGHGAKGGTLASSAADLAPTASPGPTAVLRLGGAKGATEFAVDLHRRLQGPSFDVELLLKGELLERESYEAGDSTFRVLVAGVDAFAPGIDALRYPVVDGEAWDWDGKVVYAGIARPAVARVSIHRDGDAIRSEARLTVTVDPGRPPLERRLAFWFVKGHGLVRRTFGDVSSRYPAGEAWRP